MAAMTEILAGALLDRAPGPKYLGALRFAELAPADPRPRPATLARWREPFPEGFRCSLVVPSPARISSLGAFQRDAAMDEALEWTRRAAQSLGASWVVVPTAGEISTGQRDRDRLAAWIDHYRGLDPDRTVVWSPTGLWDREHALPLASKLGLVWAFDPLQDEPPAQASLLYARLRAVGSRSRFNETLLLTVLDAIVESDAAEAVVAIDSPASFREASRLQELAQSM